MKKKERKREDRYIPEYIGQYGGYVARSTVQNVHRKTQMWFKVFAGHVPPSEYPECRLSVLVFTTNNSSVLVNC
jgi:hypothetical protein